jgi:hypothetical protein
MKFEFRLQILNKKLALTSLTSGGHSVGIVRSWTKATELLVIIRNLSRCSRLAHVNT